MSDRMKIHIINNPKTTVLLKDPGMSRELFERIRMDTGISDQNINSILKGTDGVLYVIEGHKTQDEVYQLLHRENLPQGLRESLAYSLTHEGFRRTLEWEAD